MGVLSWLFRRDDNQAHLGKSPGNGNSPDRYTEEVVGESNFQGALDRICGGRTKSGHRLETKASLVLEYGGPHAPRAIRVEINGQIVGYVERKAARAMWERLAEIELDKNTATCDAIIVGGWDRGKGDRGYYGVKLDLPADDAAQTPVRRVRGPMPFDRTLRSRPPRPYQRRQRPEVERKPWRKRRRLKLVSPWLLMAALIAVAAFRHFGGEFFENSGGLIWNEVTTPAPVSGQRLGNEIVGWASVIDGDTLEIHGVRVRLHGIDAPESGQMCSVQGQEYRCGQKAALALSDKIGNSTVTCEPRDWDRYGRVVAVCRAGGVDLNGWMVSEGWALAYRQYSTDYVTQENNASAARLGVWQGDFVAPWDWRHGNRGEVAKTQSPGGCVIKGNISSKGERIYHVPGGEFYDRTKISPAKGERWFCTEGEARAAGWRRSLR